MKYCNILLYKPISVVKLNVVLNEKQEITNDEIVSVVCSYYNIYRHELMNTSNKRKFVYPRQQAMALVREFSNDGFKTIGKFFGKDHSTVIYSINNVNDLCDVDKAYRANFIKLRAKILTAKSQINNNAA